MKKLVMLAAVATLSFSCSGDDDNNPANNNVELEGTWKLTSITTYEPLDANEDGDSTTDLIEETGCFETSKIVFGSNDTAEFTLDVPFFGECFTTMANSTWEADGNDITFNITTEDGDAVVDMERSGNTLILEDPEFFQIEIEVNGEWSTVTYGATAVYTKQ